MSPIPVSILLLALGIIGCADLMAPPRYTGAYQLRRVEGSVIPVAIPSGTDSCTTTVFRGQLDLSADTFSLTLVTSIACMDIGNSAVLGLSGGVQASGDVLNFASNLPPQAVGDVVHIRADLRGQDIDLTWLDARYGVPAGTRFAFVRAPSSP